MSSMTGVSDPMWSFDNSRSLLAVATGDGRVKLFNAAQQRLAADITQNLSGNASSTATTTIYSSITWGPEDSKALYLGTTSGDVKCINTSTMELIWTASGVIDGSVASLSTSSSSTSASTSTTILLLVLGNKGWAAVVDPLNGSIKSRFQASKNTITKGISLTSDISIIAGCSVAAHQLLPNGSKLYKWTGHPTPVTALAVSPGRKYCCSAAQGDRSIAVWSVETGVGGKLRYKAAIGQCVLQHPTVQLMTCSSKGGSKKSKSNDNDDDDDMFHIVALDTTGTLNIFSCLTTTGGNNTCDIHHWGQCSASSSSSKGIVCAAVESCDTNGINLLVAVGNSAKPSFQRTRVDLPGTNNKKHGLVKVDLASDGTTTTTTDQLVSNIDTNHHQGMNGGGGGTDAAAVVGVDAGTTIARVKRKQHDADDDSSDDDDDDMMVDNNDDKQQQQDDDDEDGPTFADRLAALQVDTNNKTTKSPSQQQGPITADSLTVLLGQALASGDRALLERCLSIQNQDIINKTVQRLPSSDAVIFLTSITSRLQSAPARGEQLASWVRAVLLHHAAYLVGSGGGCHEILSYLYQLIDVRVASYQPLLSLSGRLDLVLANAKKAHREGGGGGGGDHDDDGPMITVHLGQNGDDDIEVEDVFGLLGGDDESESEEEEEEEEHSSDDDDGDDDMSDDNE